MSIISIGLLGLAGAMTVQSGGLSASIAMGQGAVTRGYYVSTATLLAQDRMEQVKRLTYCAACSGGGSLDQLSASPPATLPDEAPVTGYANFNRQVRVENYPAGAFPMKTVTVTVSYSVPTATAVNTESVVISTLIAARP